MKLSKEDMIKIDRAISLSLYIFHHYEKMERKLKDTENYVKKLKENIFRKDNLIESLKREIEKLKRNRQIT